MGKQWRYVSHYKKQEHLNMGSNKPDVWQEVEVRGRLITIDRSDKGMSAALLPHNMGVCELVDDGVPVVRMTPEVREAAMRASAWLVDMLNDYRGDGMDDLRADVIVWRAWLTELGLQQGDNDDTTV